MENGVLKVTKGVMVVMNGLRQGSLYILKGTTVTGVAAVGIVSADANDIRL